MDDSANRELKSSQSISSQPNSNTRIKAYFNWFRDLPNFKLALIVMLGIIILIILGVLIGYMAIVLNLIKI